MIGSSAESGGPDKPSVATTASRFGLRQFAARLLGGKPPLRIKETTLLPATALFMTVVYNTTFFSKVGETYPLRLRYALFHAGLFVILTALTTILLALVGSRYTTKPIATVLFVASSVVSYFVNHYGVVVDVDMLHNVVQTNWAETRDLLSLRLVLYVVFLGIVPSVLFWRLQVEYRGFIGQLLGKLALIGGALVLIAAALFGSASTFASFLREHKPLRAYVNPLGYVYATVRFVGASRGPIVIKVEPYATDARRLPRAARRLVILVVGETARADHFSLNGYARETNPRLKREDIVNFTQVMSAGTSTAVSVPSMFSHLTREHYDAAVARRTENILDILARTGVAVLWRDNNSDSKGVALRVAYEDFRSKARNPIFDDEGRDEGMLVDLQSYVDRQPGDVLVVLHQMGSHGPAYYKRYPKAFAVFAPVRETNQLEECTPEELNNAYDNSILYTDYFLSKVIEFLKRNDERFETAMLYFSDHGESLGENRLYLHGYPYALAPLAQKHIPAVFWFGRQFPIDRDRLRARANDPYSHDNLFHTLLGLFSVQTRAYSPPLDMLRPFLTRADAPPPPTPPAGRIAPGGG